MREFIWKTWDLSLLYNHWAEQFAEQSTWKKYWFSQPRMQELSARGKGKGKRYSNANRLPSYTPKRNVRSFTVEIEKSVNERRQLWALTTTTLAADQSDRPSPSSDSIVIPVQNNCRREGRNFLSLKFSSFVSRYAHSPLCFVHKRHDTCFSDLILLPTSLTQIPCQ